MNRKYYSMVQTGNTATISIYGDITAYPFYDNDVTADSLSKQLDRLTGVSEINVYINSYGGEVAEGLAIYNALKRHAAKVNTYCDGFACSIASVIFMAGDERIMNEASLLMIHNAWTLAQGNAAELRKQADDLDKMTQASITAYLNHSNLSEKEIKKLMDAESWLLPEEAMEYGFATAIVKDEQAHASQSAKMKLLDIVKAARSAEDDENPEQEPQDEPEDDEQPEDAPETEKTDTEAPESSDDDSDDGEQPEDDSEEEPEQENAAQKWSGFFNALIKH